MTQATTSTAVKGGNITRDAKTGRFVSVSNGKRNYMASAESERVLSDVAKRRADALKRLANR